MTSQPVYLSKAQKVISLISPFFAYIMYDIPVKFSDEAETAHTNGTSITFNTNAITMWGQAGFTAVYLHEIMHVAFLHVPRILNRVPLAWNLAADIVINGYINSISGQGNLIKLPDGVIVDKSLEHLSVEEVYEELMRGVKEREKNGGKKEKGDGKEENNGYGYEGESTDLRPDDETRDSSKMKSVTSAINKAKNMLYSTLTSTTIKREIGEALRERIDWRNLLSRYLTKYADDYSFHIYDRRFEDIFIPDIHGEKIRGRIEVDTSGSISADKLNNYIGDVVSILSSFENISLTVSLFHTSSYAEYEVSNVSHLDSLSPHIGGTSFVDSLSKSKDYDFVIFLTDLYGEFPMKEPDGVDVIWVSDGGDEAPFGMVIKVEE